MGRITSLRGTWPAVLLLTAGCTTVGDSPFREQPGGETDFDTTIRPLLVAHDCASRGCHGGGSASGGLSVETVDDLRAGGDSGPAVVPCDLGASVLLGRVADPPSVAPRMPPSEDYLDAEELALLGRWVLEGAAADFDPAACEPVDFAARVLPIFDTYGCAGCHPGAGGLGLGTVAELLAGGDRGPAVVPCDGEGSLLVEKLRGTAPGGRMPLGGPPWVAEADVATIVAWIDQGAAETFDPEACP